MGRSLDQIEGSLVNTETVQCDFEVRISELESSQAQLQKQVTWLQLQQDDAENRSRRNNIRLRGLPESVKGPELRTTVVGILNGVLERPQMEKMEIDRVHRVKAPRRTVTELIPDVLIRIHLFSLKEDIMRQAWAKGQIEYEGSQLKLLPDLSRGTLKMRAAIKPLLEVIRKVGATYFWGHPFHLKVVKDRETFLLKWPDQLPGLFTFLGCAPIHVSDWIDVLGNSVNYYMN